jgi:hypothetical protein
MTTYPALQREGRSIPQDRLRLARALSGFTMSEEPKFEPRAQRSTPPHQLADSAEFNADIDCKHAPRDSRFDRTVHIFHQNWHGIRSAAGTLPGNKAAFPLHKGLAPADLIEIVSRFEGWGITKAVFHGFSYQAEKVLRAVTGAGIECYLVWHGNLAQLVWEPEAQYFEAASAACRSGRFLRAHMMKAGMEKIFTNGFRPMLVNRAPDLPRSRLVAPFAGDRVIALVPAHTDIRKNLHTNLVACATSEHISDVFYYASLAATPSILARCRQVSYSGHEGHLALLSGIDICVNVTVVDCHPMVDLEALGAGAMALSGPLNLDVLEEHEFTQLSTIQNPFSVEEIVERINRLAAMPKTEISAIIEDYKAKLNKICLSRYVEFLGL